MPSPETVHSPTVPSLTSPSQNIAGSTDGQSRWRANGLCHASFWIAFRQEIYASFLKQRSINLDLSRCEAFRDFSPAEDTVWADRLIIFCADVLEFCYGNTKTDPSRQESCYSSTSSTSTKDRWISLKQRDRMWTDVLPASFE